MKSSSVALVLLVALGCGPPPPVEQPDGMVGQSFAIQRVGPQTLGLGYGEVRTIGVRYLDGKGQPLVGQTIHFGIFGDPQGSTLSADRGATRADGEAEVHLSAGAAEAQFKVVASAPNAPDVSFDVSVSKFAFTELDALLDYNGAEMGSVASVEARLYGDRRCDKLRPEGTPPAALRTATATGAHATLPFPFLLAVSYALSGRALDAQGKLVAWGCVDVDAAQLATTRLVVVPVPLVRTLPSVTGIWAVATKVSITPPPPVVAAWRQLVDCPRAPAQQLLDGIVASADSTVASLLQAQRGDVDSSGCRPAMINGSASLDETLHALLTVKGAPALALPSVVADLEAIVGGAELTSRLELVPLASAGDGSGGQLLIADHRLETLTLHGLGGAVTYSLPQLGLPIYQRGGIPATLSGTTLGLDQHSFTLRLPALWARALGELALTPRGLPPTGRLLVAAIVGAASRMVGMQTLTGCAAVEDLLCAAANTSPCSLATACATASEALATRLERPLAAPTGADLLLGGSATTVDSDGDLVTETLKGGAFAAEVTVATPDERRTAKWPWTAARTQ